METGTIVEYKACKRNSVANLEFKAFAKAFPVSNMLVPQFLRKRIVLATTFQESSRAQARLTKRCRGYYSYPFLESLPCKLCNVFHSVAGKASNGSFPRCSHLFKVCVCVCRIIKRWMMCSFFAACYCTTLEPERLIETRLNGFWFLCTLRCIFFHQKCHVLIVSLPGRILSPLPFSPITTSRPTTGTAVVSAMALAAAASGWPHPAPRWRPTPKTPGRAAKLLRKSVLQVSCRTPLTSQCLGLKASLHT